MEYYLLKELSIDNYVFDVNKDKWIFVGEVPEVLDIVKSKEKRIDLTRHYFLYQENSIDNIYFLQPYTFESIESMLKKKKINGFNLIFSFKEKNWVYLKDVHEFKHFFGPEPKRRPTILGSSKVTAFKRNFKRSPFYSTAKINVGGVAVGGHCTTIGAGGCFIETKSDLLNISDKIEVEIVSDIVQIDFKCQAEVVGKVKEKFSGVCLKFLEIDDDIKNKIDKIVSENKI